MNADGRLSVLLVLGCVLCLVAFTAARESDAGGPPDYNVSGAWNVTEQVTSCDCPDCTSNPPYVLQVTQSGSSLTVYEATILPI